MGVSKVEIMENGTARTIMDLTGDTVNPEALAEGYTAHNATGEPIAGEMKTTTVLYTEQNLTAEQKAQARDNIDATGVYVGSGDMPDGYNIQIDPNGNVDADGIVTREEFNQLQEEKVDYQTLFDYAQANYADMSTVVKGLLHTDGTVYTGDSYANYYYFDMFIPVSEGDVLSSQWTMDGVRCWSVTMTAGYTSLARVTAYDKNKNVVSSSGASNVNSYTVPVGIEFVKITVYYRYIDEWTELSIVKNATSVSDYVEYGKNEITTIKKQYIPKISSGTADVDVENIFCAIPKTIHIAVGKEFKMYYKNVLSRYTERLWLGYTSGIVVKRYSDYLSITASEAMTKNINWKVYDESFNVLDSGTMQIIATEDVAKTSKVLIIGDSTVTQSNAISQKLLDCYSESNGNLTLLGVRGTSPALHEGRAGWTSTMYCTVASNGSIANPFYNNGFDFSYYMTQQGYNGVDIVDIQLGINDIFSMTHENFDASATLNNLDTMITSILAYDSNIKIIVNLISVPNGNGTSFTDTYNTTQIDFVYLVNTIRLSNALIEHFDGNANVTISPNNCVLDAKTDINDGVHPNLTGYTKLGQAIYETINGIYEESESGNDEPSGEPTALWDLKTRTGVQEGNDKSTIPATTARTRETDKYYYLDTYAGVTGTVGTYTFSDYSATDDTLEFTVGGGTAAATQFSSYGIVVPLDLEVGKSYMFQVQNATTNLGCRLMTYTIGSDGKWTYESNAVIAYSTTDLKTLTITPESGKGYAIHFSQKSAGCGTKNVFSNISLVENE